MSVVELDERTVEAIAKRVVERVVELLADEPSAADPLVNAATVARSLGVSRAFVYEHADQLGAIRPGGKKGPVRFDLAKARAAHTTEPDGAESPQPAPNRRRTRTQEPTAGGILTPRPGGRKAAA